MEARPPLYANVVPYTDTHSRTPYTHHAFGRFKSVEADLPLGVVFPPPALGAGCKATSARPKTSSKHRMRDAAVLEVHTELNRSRVVYFFLSRFLSFLLSVDFASPLCQTRALVGERAKDTWGGYGKH